MIFFASQRVCICSPNSAEFPRWLAVCPVLLYSLRSAEEADNRLLALCPLRVGTLKCIASGLGLASKVLPQERARSSQCDAHEGQHCRAHRSPAHNGDNPISDARWLVV